MNNTNNSQSGGYSGGSNDFQRELGSIHTKINYLEKTIEANKREAEMKLDKVDSKIDQKFKEVDAKLDGMKHDIHKDLSAVNKNIHVKMDSNFKSVNDTVNSIDEKLDQLNNEKYHAKGFLKAISIGAAVLGASGGLIVLVIKVAYPHL